MLINKVTIFCYTRKLQRASTLLLKFFRIDEMGCKILVGGTALLSFLYH